MYTFESRRVLNNGVEMPIFGLGVYLANDKEELKQAIKTAILNGYRHIDTAKIYENEAYVGEALAEIFEETDIKREDIFVTTKLWKTDMGSQESVQAAYERSCELLQLEYVDMYLIHWPGEDAGIMKSTWKAMEEMLEQGGVRAIGVSNFETYHLDVLLEDAQVIPAINQIELHPREPENEILAYCEPKGIAIEAWSPLMQGSALLQDPILEELADKYEKTTAQIILRWDLQRHVMVIPKSVTARHIIENATIFDFELTDEDMQLIALLANGQRLVPKGAPFSV